MSATSHDCERFQELCSECIDGELDAACAAELDEHLAACPACRQFMATLRETVERCRQVPRPCVGEDCFRRAVEAARAELHRRGLLD